ncbi:MAG: hypothetical protein JNN15_04005, partial [Blastocatellia bacterium]|nr:hypothetical protein [Blastocatellia bacterium]
MKRLLRLALVLVCVGFLFGIAPARANNFNLLSDENLVASSEAIITGHVTYMESRSSGGKIYTDITVSISEVIKGRFSSKTIVIEQLGGRSASHQVWLTNSPEFKIGEEVLLFLSADSQGVMHTTHLSMGKFSISRKGNESLIENAARISNGEKPEKADQYIDKIKRLSAQENVVTAELKTMPSDYQQGKGQFIEEFSNFTLLSRRFFE